MTIRRSLGGKLESCCGKSGNMCLVHVRAAEGSSTAGRGVSIHVATHGQEPHHGRGEVSGQHQFQ